MECLIVGRCLHFLIVMRGDVYDKERFFDRFINHNYNFTNNILLIVLKMCLTQQ